MPKGEQGIRPEDKYMITFVSKGDFSKTKSFLTRAKRLNLDTRALLEKYGQLGVKALAENTPKDSGATADSWSYKIQNGNGETSIIWSNNNMTDGVPVAILLRFGHATGTGGYVQGTDYISPAIRPLFDEFAISLWKELNGK